MLKLNLFILFAIIISAHCEIEQEPNPKLLVSKHILNNYLVQHKDILVKYTIFNVGTSSAVDVELVDEGFHHEAFSYHGGQLVLKYARIPPQTNVTSIAIVRPLKYGYFNFSSAEVYYRFSEYDEQVHIVESSEPGEGAIISYKDYYKKFSSHTLDWIAFAIMTLPSLAIPFSLWFKSKNKYEKLLKPKRGY